MLEELLKLKDGANTVSEFTEAIRRGIPSAVFGVNEAFKAFLAANVDSPVLYVAKDMVTASAAAELIAEFSKKKTVYIPPKDEILVSAKAYSKDISFERIKALYEASFADVIVTTADALMQTAPKKTEKITLVRGEDASQEETVKELVRFGYRRVEKTESKATFSLRGDVLDVFPINAEVPVRIDFFGDCVESIKKFDPETRASLGFTDEVTVLQAFEFLISDEDAALAEAVIKNELRSADKDARANLRMLADEITVAKENSDADVLSVLSPLSENCGDLFGFLKDDAVVIIDEAKRIKEIADLSEREFTERYNSLKKTGEVFSFAARNLCGTEELTGKLKKFRLAALQTLSTAIPFFNPLQVFNPQVGGVSNYRLDFKELFTDINNWLYGGYSVLITTGDAKRARNLCADLSDRGIASSVDTRGEIKGVSISSEKLSCGFVFHETKTVVIGSGNLFAKPVAARKIKLKSKGFFTAPEKGDYCVHETHGIGRVLGNKRISTAEGTKDYISVEYAGGDVLHIPVEQMDILTRYLGGEKKPRLSKIGGADFDKIKKAVKESIKKMSFDLKKLYEERETAQGYKFVCDEELEKAFAAAFPFEETADQEICDREIKEDMTSGKVMDRLVCGDVGFGKTEVAFRAVFRAIANGKQAAMLAPTTILTEQHFNTAKERFKDFGVKIAVLNRFKTDKEQRLILKALENGEIDFIIGTHRLLSKDVKFKDLGILVLDEEQRFGVEHKEKIKLLKKNVDALTLTATPIPRTLHMSLSGIRSISVINTPPKKRLPVQTYVTEESEGLIKDAVSREANRGGQSFILYNRIESIFTFAARLAALMPELKFTVVHGRMDERVMEKNVMDFYEGKSNVLVSTTIIENGIDLPKANTLIVIDADNLGLSTLYQLKGRVGRSDRLAYAYFTFKREKILSDTAFDRLNAIIEFAEMGSGIKIAMRDLEIRGAGNILGAEQHGHMDKIGYELYSKLLREELSGKEEKIPELDVRVTAFIPETYIESETSRMDAYKEIAELGSIKAEQEFAAETENVYGPLPTELKNLMAIAVVKFLAMKTGVSEIVVRKGETSLSFENFNAFANEKLMRATEKYSDTVKISMSAVPKLEFAANGRTNEEMLKVMREFLVEAAG